MKYDPDIHHRRSIRLREYDYSSTGAYFVTTCTQGRECLFGDVVDGAIRLNPAGGNVWAAWDELPERFPNIVMDEFVVMPNHFHGIIMLNDVSEPDVHPEIPMSGSVGAIPCVRPPLESCGCPTLESCGCPPFESCVRPTFESCVRPTFKDQGEHKVRPYGTAEGTVGRIVQVFKSMTTNAYINGVKENGWPPFPGRLWQRNYFERVIRDDRELDAARKYILENPIKWYLDRENPQNVSHPTNTAT